MQDAHAGRSAINFDHRRDLRLLQAPYFPGDVAKRKGENPASILHVNPFIGRTKAAFAKHARRNHDPLTAIEAASDQPTVSEFFEIATYVFAGIPTVAQFRHIRSHENFAAFQFAFVERRAGIFITHSFIRCPSWVQDWRGARDIELRTLNLERVLFIAVFSSPSRQLSQPALDLPRPGPRRARACPVLGAFLLRHAAASRARKASSCPPPRSDCRLRGDRLMESRAGRRCDQRRRPRAVSVLALSARVANLRGDAVPCRRKDRMARRY